MSQLSHPVQPAPVQPAPVQPAAPLIAGKYTNVAQLEQGIREIARSVGYEFDQSKVLIGPGGHAADVNGAVEIYKGLERLQATKASTQPAPVQPAPVQPTPAQQPTPTQPQPTPAQQPAGETRIQVGLQVTERTTIDDIVKAAGLDRQVLATQFQTQGRLSDEQYNAIFQSSKLPRDIVDRLATLEMHQTQSTAEIKNELVEMVGGQSQFDTLLGSANQFLTATEIEGYEDDFNGNEKKGIRFDPHRARRAMQSMLYRHQEALKSGKMQPVAAGDLVQTPAAGSGGEIATRQEYFKIGRLAERGDKAAQQKLLDHSRAGGRRFA